MIRLPARRWLLSAGAIALVGGLAAWLLAPSAARGDDALVTTVKRGDFRVMVTSAGELRARQFVQVQGPANAQQIQVYQLKISSLVPEGTVVKEGDVVAELDRSPVATKLSEVGLALQKAEAQLTQAQLDSTLNLSQAREDIRTQEFALEERRIAKEQAQYEAPSIKRQAEIDYQKAQRALAQAKSNYVTKTDKSIAKMREVGADVERQRNQFGMVQQVMQGFTIRAPSPGMVIYVKEWNGRKRTAGSQIGPWEPTVATLPDLSQMESVTYVNEVDVRKLAVGQPTWIGLDADPSKKLRGTVTSVANVGEQRPNADSKVFEVKVAVESPDTTLRPGMTTSNAIETRKIENAIFIPIESVMSEGNTPLVFRRSGGRVTRQQVETGAMNDNEIVVLRGLAVGDQVLLAAPPDGASLPLVSLPLDPRRPVPAGDTPATQMVPTNPRPAAPGARAEPSAPATAPPAHR
jgi:RND family efflux transporter MFP subunit